MAKRKPKVEQRFPKDHDHGLGDEFVPPDRPDQIDIDPNDRPEEIDIFSKESAAAAEREERETDPELEERPEPIAPREERERTDEGTALPMRSDREDREEREERTERRGSKEKYSKDVQRRINREYALRKRADARLAQERTARQQLEQRLAKVERAQVDEAGQASLKEINDKMRDTAAKLAEAKEANDTKREVELQIELGDLQGQKVQLQAKLDRERDERARAPARTDAAADDDGGAPTRGRSAEWIRAQRRWWNTTRWSGAHQDAIAHDTTILAEIEEGELDFEPYSDEHLEELSRRLKSDYPDLEVRTIDGELFEELEEEDEDDRYDDDRRERMGNRREDDDIDDRRTPARKPNGKQRPARAPMGGLGGRDGRRERNEIEMARRGKITLTEKDFAEMRTFKLDPNDPEHKKAFARERARTLLRSANNGAQRR